MNRYYLTQRPPAPGTFPGKPVNIEAFDTRKHVDEIGRLAWGWIEYEDPLTEEQVLDYELTRVAPKRIIVLNEDQANLLAMYILMTTKYREGEIKACSELAQEKDADGIPKFPNMVSNAKWWKATHRELGRIRKTIDNAPGSQAGT